jgi:hypothetical protein
MGGTPLNFNGLNQYSTAHHVFGAFMILVRETQSRNSHSALDGKCDQLIHWWANLALSRGDSEAARNKERSLSRKPRSVRLTLERESREKVAPQEMDSLDQRRISSDRAIKSPMPMTARFTNVRPSLRASPAPP